jgi:hypothetical protein
MGDIDHQGSAGMFSEPLSIRPGDRADALRIRVEAQAECERQLHARRKEWLNE